MSKSLSAASVEILTKLVNHQSGLPRISTSTSILSESEHEYIALFGELARLNLVLDELRHENSLPADSAPEASEDELNTLQGYLHHAKFNDLILENVLISKPIAQAVTDGQGPPDQSVILDELIKRDIDSKTLMKSVRRNDEMKSMLDQLVVENRNLHSENQRLVSRIGEISVAVRSDQKAQFSQQQILEYEGMKNSYAFSRKKNAVLNEFLVSLVVATGVDWASNELLRQTVLECGADDENNEDSFL